MSELYLVLRNRLPADMEWVQIGKPQLQEARKAKGLSYESAARLLNISSQTVYRREKEGRWPAHEIEALAEVYGLEIERPEPQRISFRGPADLAQAAAALASAAQELHEAAVSLQTLREVEQPQRKVPAREQR